MRVNLPPKKANFLYFILNMIGERRINSEFSVLQIFLIGISFLFVSTAMSQSETQLTSKGDFFTSAKALYTKGEYQKSGELIWENIEKCDTNCLLFLCSIHDKEKNGLQLMKSAQLAEGKSAKKSLVQLYKGKANRYMRKHKEAMESLKLAIELDKRYEPAYEEIFQIYLERKNYYELRILVQDMIDLIGPKPSYLNRLCDINVRDGMGTQAKSMCQMAIKNDPDFPDNYVNMASVLIAEEQMLKGKAMLKHAYNKFPTSEVAAVAWGQFHENEKNYLEAYNAFKRCTTNSPNSETCLIGHGMNAAQLKKHAESIDKFRMACKLSRKAAGSIRKAGSLIRTEKEAIWTSKYEVLADQCAD